jgi:hypothetical protein
MTSPNLQVALQWSSAGAYVFPADQNKRPRLKWRDESTTNPETIKRWWAQWPDSVPAIDLAKSDLVVLDGDRHGGPDGVEGLSQLLKEHHLDTAAIPIVVTQGYGRHAWFRQPTEGEPLGNRDKAVRDSGINVRGHGGYVIAPGTRMPNGGEYKRCPGTPSTIEAFKNGTIPVLPPSLVELLRAAPSPPAQTNEAARTSPLPPRATPQSREQSYAEKALRNQANELAAMRAETGRNNELNTAALKMGHQVAAGRIDRSTVEHTLYNASMANGLVKDTGPNAVRATIASGLNRGITEPSPAVAGSALWPQWFW